MRVEASLFSHNGKLFLAMRGGLYRPRFSRLLKIFLDLIQESKPDPGFPLAKGLSTTANQLDYIKS